MSELKELWPRSGVDLARLQASSWMSVPLERLCESPLLALVNVDARRISPATYAPDESQDPRVQFCCTVFVREVEDILPLGLAARTFECVVLEWVGSHSPSWVETMLAPALPNGGYGTLSMSTLLLLFRAAWAMLMFGGAEDIEEVNGDLGAPVSNAKCI